MNGFTLATVSFPDGRLAASFLKEYRARYVDAKTGWTAASWDDTAHTRMREASLSPKGKQRATIKPAGKYSVPRPKNPKDFTKAWRDSHRTGDTITTLWPDKFLADIERNPQPEPELFGGILILSKTP